MDDKSNFINLSDEEDHDTSEDHDAHNLDNINNIAKGEQDIAVNRTHHIRDDNVRHSPAHDNHATLSPSSENHLYSSQAEANLIGITSERVAGHDAQDTPNHQNILTSDDYIGHDYGADNIMQRGIKIWPIIASMVTAAGILSAVFLGSTELQIIAAIHMAAQWATYWFPLITIILLSGIFTYLIINHRAINRHPAIPDPLAHARAQIAEIDGFGQKMEKANDLIGNYLVALSAMDSKEIMDQAESTNQLAITTKLAIGRLEALHNGLNKSSSEFRTLVKDIPNLQDETKKLSAMLNKVGHDARRDVGHLDEAVSTLTSTGKLSRATLQELTRTAFDIKDDMLRQSGELTNIINGAAEQWQKQSKSLSHLIDQHSDELTKKQSAVFEQYQMIDESLDEKRAAALIAFSNDSKRFNELLGQYGKKFDADIDAMFEKGRQLQEHIVSLDREGQDRFEQGRMAMSEYHAALMQLLSMLNETHDSNERLDGTLNTVEERGEQIYALLSHDIKNAINIINVQQDAQLEKFEQIQKLGKDVTGKLYTITEKNDIIEQYFTKMLSQSKEIQQEMAIAHEQGSEKLTQLRKTASTTTSELKSLIKLSKKRLADTVKEIEVATHKAIKNGHNIVEGGVDNITTNIAEQSHAKVDDIIKEDVNRFAGKLDNALSSQFRPAPLCLTIWISAITKLQSRPSYGRLA